jgi:hypothetical protein
MESVYWIIPAGAKPLYLLVPAVLLILGAVVMLLITAVGSQRSSFRVTDDQLQLRGDLYRRSIPLDRLVLDSARVVNLQAEPSLQPRRRTVGTAAPGYLSGWFRLRNREKALLYLTARDRVLYAPTRDGYSLLLSVDRPDEMLNDLRARSR